MRIFVLQCPLSVGLGGDPLGFSRLPQLLWIFASFTRSASADFSAFAALITSAHVKSSSDDIEILILSRRRALYVQPQPSSSQRKFLPEQSQLICEENNTQSLDEQAALNVHCAREFSSHRHSHNKLTTENSPLTQKCF